MRKNRKYTKEELSEVAKGCFSIAETARGLGLLPNGSVHTFIKNLLIRNEIDTSHFRGQAWSKGKTFPAKQHWSSVFGEIDGKTGRQKPYVLRRAMIQSGREYKCERCENTGEWHGHKLRLQVDHKDGNWRNNSQDNLGFLCPNCHSIKTQEDMNLKRKNQCKQCGNRIKSKLKFCSVTCSNRFNGAKPKPTKIKWPDQQSLTEMSEELGFSAAGRILGVSDNAIRKRLRKTPS